MAVKYKKTHKTSSKPKNKKQYEKVKDSDPIPTSLLKDKPEKKAGNADPIPESVYSEGKSTRKIKQAIKHFLLTLLCIVLAVIIAAVGIIYIFEKGPSSEIKELFVVTVQQSSAAKPLAYLFLSKDEVATIMENNSAQGDTGETDPGLVEIDDTLDMDAITVEDVYGGTYRGKVMIINDPSRLYVFSIPDYTAARGMKLSAMVKSEKAIAGINGGGFKDDGGFGNGSVPRGVVISKGVWLNGSKTSPQQLMGFDKNNKLVVGTMTGNRALELGIRDAVSWGPSLIINGEPVDVGNGGGLNPRSAIGQRADGAVILVAIEGRQPGSMGASYLDLIQIMQDYGAVNAGNLDGGNSSGLIYDGKILNKMSSISGERYIPTAILVKAR